MNDSAGPSPETAAPPGQIRCRVIGVGNAGCNALEQMAPADFEGVGFLALSTHARALTHCTVTEKFALGYAQRHGLGTGGDPDQGRAAAEADADRLRRYCEGMDLVFLLAGMGGGTGGGAAPVLARLAKEAGALVLAVVTLPFDWEGPRRQRQAAECLDQLKAVADSVICVPNQKIFKLLDENTSVLDTFRLINDVLTQGVRGIWRLLSQNGLIHIDFTDLCAVTRDRHSANALATAEAAGENRTRAVVDKLLAHPLIENGSALAESDAVLVSLVGGTDLTMAEIRRVMDQINRQCPDARVIVGAAVDPRLQDRLSITLIAGRAASSPNGPADPELANPEVERLTPGAEDGPKFETTFFHRPEMPRVPSRFVPPPPELTPERREQILAQKTKGSGKRKARLQQGVLPLEVVSKGRFEKSEPTVYRGEDLDVPTYVRRGIALN
jgi:cell division protein FtsZ